jgi:hypothetical protein
MDLKTIEREALGLTPANRAKLAHELLESLDALSPAEIDELWLDEAERRLKDLDEVLIRHLNCPTQVGSSAAGAEPTFPEKPVGSAASRLEPTYEISRSFSGRINIRSRDFPSMRSE